jgi:hypothetical protein
MDLETLKKYSSGDLPHRQYLAVHREAAELLEILHEHLHPGEFVVTLTDWPAARPRPTGRQYMALKTMMLLTPFVLVCGFLLAASYPEWALLSGITWFAMFTGVAMVQLIMRRSSASKSREGRSVVAVSRQRIMRIWLDGSGEFQSWPLGKDKSELPPMEPVSDTIKLLLHLDLGNISLN